MSIWARLQMTPSEMRFRNSNDFTNTFETVNDAMTSDMRPSKCLDPLKMQRVNYEQVENKSGLDNFSNAYGERNEETQRKDFDSQWMHAMHRYLSMMSKGEDIPNDDQRSKLQSADTEAFARPSESRSRQFCKTKLCPHFLNGHCIRQSACSYAHSSEELVPRPDLKKTKLCAHTKRGEVCTRPRCTYAHSVKELKLPDQSDTYKTSHCLFWRKSRCYNGRKCRFAHGDRDLRVKAETTSDSVLRAHLQNLDLGARAASSSSPAKTSYPLTIESLAMLTTNALPDIKEHDDPLSLKTSATGSTGISVSNDVSTSASPMPPCSSTLLEDTFLAKSVISDMQEKAISPSSFDEQYHDSFKDFIDYQNCNFSSAQMSAPRTFAAENPLKADFYTQETLPFERLQVPPAADGHRNVRLAPLQVLSTIGPYCEATTPQDQDRLLASVLASLS